MNNDIILTGIKPTGDPHLGNYFGAIQPALTMANAHSNEKKFFFIADYHALTTIKDPVELLAYRYHVAATWLSFFDEQKACYFYFQSQIPEIFELYWILSCFCPKGLLNRAHAYKAVAAKNIEMGHDEDRNINQGLFSYPVLMAADILLFHATKIPIGPDQKQHVEIAIDIVQNLNRRLNQPIPLPEPIIQKNNPLVMGTDGQKMSKNYNNTIPIFSTEKDLKKQISKIQTDSKPLGDPLDSNTCNVFQLFSLVATDDQISQLKNDYDSGAIGYGHAKQRLSEAIQHYFNSANNRFNALISDQRHIDQRLDQSTRWVSDIAKTNLGSIKKSLGLIK